jgi:hypothetical protein
VIVQAGASFEGVLSCRHASRIDGYFRGDVVGEDRIELGEQSDVSGRIEAREIIVAGLFEGELGHRRVPRPRTPGGGGLPGDGALPHRTGIRNRSLRVGTDLPSP